MKFCNSTPSIFLLLLIVLNIQSCKNDDDDSIISENDDSDNALAFCENGFAGNYPCNGYDLMAHMPLSTLASSLTTNTNTIAGNDIWGWTDASNGNEYAIVCTTNSTAFVNVTNPINPVFLGRLETETIANSWRDAKIYNNHVFIVADNAGTHGMQVFNLTRLRNITNPPQTFNADFVYNGVTECHNIFINESEGVAYLVGCNIYDGGPVFIDISNPTNPLEIGGFADNGYSHDAQVVTYNGPDTDYTGKQIYIGSNGKRFGANKVVIIDVTDKTNPIFISEISYSNPGYAHQGWFTEDMQYFIFGDELDENDFGTNTRTIIFDFTDLDDPKYKTDYLGASAAIDHNGYVKGNSYFLANYTAGMRVLDITNIANNSINETGFFDTHPENDGTNFNGAWSVYPYFSSGNIIINDINRGLFIVRKSE
ncbi:MAG: choice-of-anchor B family protein [Algibacter sp.]|uniref:choice-of-anchor B family protein n=1 Tax=Algibacter sp. TaxID=1872428 RepID=UPI002616650F|nr:choice-of-anchor B family protein [Algibacter sp.]MDG1731008.1 choice-of-anchor B family protein [Algibacter sp.]MDG2179915.1 choice-of-anchor B family protein [Algibacter sp.]